MGSSRFTGNRQTDMLEKSKTTISLRPPTTVYHHQDSLFDNAFQSRAHFVVHPQWVSETVGLPEPIPLNRPSWSWEQPRYRQIIETHALLDHRKCKFPTLPTVPYTTHRTYSFVQPGSKFYKAFY
ncbi:hypothetical protein ScPMuIL_015807 [Solemya velum]